MTKILYIEDNIDASLIVKLFRKLLSKDLRSKISETKNKEEILGVVSKSENLDICTNFIEAIKIIEAIKKYSYDLIILDRDLYSILDKEKIKTLGNYDESLLPQNFDKELFSLREGDYLITLLHNKIDIEKQLYFLSGNNDDIREKSEFKYFLTDNFKNNNIFSKETRDYDKLRKIIDSNICVKYNCGKNNESKPYIKILDKYLEDKKDGINNYLEVTKNKNSNDKTIIKGNLVNLRQLLENHISATIINKIDNNFLPKWHPSLHGTHGINFGGFLSLLNEEIPKLNWKNGKKKGYIISTDEEISKLIKNIDNSYKFNKNGVYKLSIGSLISFMKQKNEKSFDSIGKNAKNIEELTFRYKNRFNKKLLVDENIYSYMKYSWRVLSALIHDDGAFDDEKLNNFIKNEERAINTINILYFQLKEIILWFGKVMEELES